MDTIIETVKVVAWTLGVTSAVGAIVLAYLSLRLRRTGLLRPAVYLALVSVPLLSVAIGSLADGLRPKGISVGVAFFGLGVLGLLTTTRYRLIMWLQPYSITTLGVGLLTIMVAVQTAPDSLDIRRPSGLTEQATVIRSIDGDTTA